MVARFKACYLCSEGLEEKPSTLPAQDSRILKILAAVLIARSKAKCPQPLERAFSSAVLATNEDFLQFTAAEACHIPLGKRTAASPVVAVGGFVLKTVNALRVCVFRSDVHKWLTSSKTKTCLDCLCPSQTFPVCVSTSQDGR